MASENYKNIIIGSGEGGKFLAWHLAQSGEKTVVVAPCLLCACVMPFAVRLRAAQPVVNNV